MLPKTKTNQSLDHSHADGVITLWIDSYNEIFSDFDPRPFSERSVSDDFVTQVKRVSHEHTGKITVLRLLTPEGTQNKLDENIIIGRLQFYFKNRAIQLGDERAKIRRKGIAFTVCGIILMIISTYISFLQLSEFIFKLFLALFEPGGWFLLWTGLDWLISNSWDKKSEVFFYNRFEDIKVEFNSYK